MKKQRDEEKTITVETASTTNMPEARGPSESDPKLTSWSRLDDLYTITKLLMTFESAGEVMAAILSVVSKTLPLRSAVLIEETAGHPQLACWSREGPDDPALEAAKRYAASSYAYLTGTHLAAGTKAPMDREPIKSHKGSPERTKYIVIPLVVGRQSVFGCFQVEGTAISTEADLTFINAIANQLAIALDRHRAWQRETAARREAEAAERRMRFLADASRLLSASFDYRSAWENVARLTVLEIADYCFIDIFEDESLRRTVLVSPDRKPEIPEKEVKGLLKAVAREVLKTRRPAIYPGMPGDPEIPEEEAVDSRRFESYMCVPLRINEHALGTLTLISTLHGRLYKQHDLVLLEDLARRAVVAFENAQHYADALQAIRSRDDVLAVVSHDLKGPLTVVLGFVNMFLSKAKPDEPLVCDRQQVETVQRQGNAMKSLIDDLLDSASIDARHLYVEREECTIGGLVGEALDLPRHLAHSKPIDIKSEVPPGLPSVFVDRHKILQVFANLIGNAIKFTPPGGTVTVRAERFQDDIQFCVEDTGPGIPQEEVAHLFDRFWQARKTARFGTGLGLYIVKGIVEGHGGHIWVDSKPGEGSRFFFTLPLDWSNKKDD